MTAKYVLNVRSLKIERELQPFLIVFSGEFLTILLHNQNCQESLNEADLSGFNSNTCKGK